jgi:hypothetical protein
MTIKEVDDCGAYSAVNMNNSNMALKIGAYSRLKLLMEWVLQVMFPSACSFIVLLFTVLYYMFRPTWPSSSV